MKKLAIATAVTLMATSAMAQSVQVYGLVDTAVRYDSKANANGDSKAWMVNGGQSTSRIGFRGTEDLGNGLSAGFNLEGGFGANTGVSSQNGSAGAVLFDRRSYVLLKDKSMGELQIGRNTTAIYDLAAQGVTDPLKIAMDGVSAPVTAGNSTYVTKPLRINQVVSLTASSNGYRAARSDGMIKYLNAFGPVDVIIGYAPGGTTGDTGLKSSYTYSANFKQNDFSLATGQFVATDESNKKLTASSVGGFYKLGKATATVGYHTLKTDTGYVGANLTTTKTYEGPILGKSTDAGPSTDAKVATVGVKYDFTPKFATTVAYYDGNYKNGANVEGDLKSMVVFNEYYLSKRTNLYGVVDYTKASGGLVSTSTSSSSVGVMTGIRHTF